MTDTPKVNVKAVVRRLLFSIGRENEADAFISGLSAGGVTVVPTAAHQRQVEALRASYATFRVYEANHRSKGTPEGDEKAAANATAAALCEAALLETERMS